MAIFNKSARADVVVTEVLAGAAPVTAANYGAFFNADRRYKVKKIQALWRTASASGTLQVEKLTGTQAKGAGAALLSSTISTAGTAETLTTGTLTSTNADLVLAAGDRLGLLDGGTLTSSAQLSVTVVLSPLS